MIIDCAHYKDGVRRDEGAVALEEAAARTTQGGFVWLGLFEPGPEELAQVSETFGLHEPADYRGAVIGRRIDTDNPTGIVLAHIKSTLAGGGQIALYGIAIVTL